MITNKFFFITSQAGTEQGYPVTGQRISGTTPSMDDYCPYPAHWSVEFSILVLNDYQPPFLYYSPNRNGIRLSGYRIWNIRYKFTNEWYWSLPDHSKGWIFYPCLVMITKTIFPYYSPEPRSKAGRPIITAESLLLHGQFTSYFFIFLGGGLLWPLPCPLEYVPDINPHILH